MKKVLWLIVCLMTMVIGFASCSNIETDAKKNNFEKSIEPILEKNENWQDNELVEITFDNEMTTFFKNAVGTQFQDFYDGVLSFNKIIGINEKEDSVLVAFKYSETIWLYPTKNRNCSHHNIEFNVITNIAKDDAMRLGGNTKCKLKGKIIGYEENLEGFCKDIGIFGAKMGTFVCKSSEFELTNNI